MLIKYAYSVSVERR